MSITTSKKDISLEDSLREEIKKECYGVVNNHFITVNEDDENCLAKHITTKNIHMHSHKYYVLVDIRGNIYDLTGQYSQREINTTNQKFGKPFWKFKKISEAGFYYYLRYLQNQNHATYLLANREAQSL